MTGSMIAPRELEKALGLEQELEERRACWRVLAYLQFPVLVP
jgi:hypothetical protein